MNPKPSSAAKAASRGGRTNPIRQARRTATARSADDPIYRAIEEHRKSGQERYEISRKPGRTDHELDDAIANELDALRRLFSTAPTTHDGMVALFRHCHTALPGEYTTVIEEFVEMCVNGDEDKWSSTRWARMMELALRRIAPTHDHRSIHGREGAGHRG